MAFKVVDLRNKSSINASIDGGSLRINFRAPAQMYSVILLMGDQKRTIDEVHPVKLPPECLCQLDDELLEKDRLQSPL